MAEVIQVDRLEDLQRYRMVWRNLLPATSGATFFQSYDWLESYWGHFGDDQQMCVLIIQSCGEVIGIVPLCVRRERYRVGPLNVLTYPLEYWGTWYGPIGPNVAGSMLMTMHHIRRRGPAWDLLELRWTDAARSDRGRTQRAMRAAGFRPQTAAFQQASAISLKGNWDDYWRARGSKWRNNMRRASRRLEQQATIDFIRHRPASAAEGDGDPAWPLYDACVHIAQQSWQGGRGDGTTLSNGRVESFLRSAHAAAARNGMVDMNLLLLNGIPAAFAYNYHFNGRVQGLRTGFDPRVCSHGAGTLLMMKAIEDSFRRGDRHYDLGVGYHHYKQRFRTHVETSYRFSHYRGGVLPQSLRLARWWKGTREGELQSEKVSAIAVEKAMQDVS